MNSDVNWGQGKYLQRKIEKKKILLKKLFFCFLSNSEINWGWGISWDGMDGWDGTEYQKCPLIFFILCGYIDKVYTYFYM